MSIDDMSLELMSIDPPVSAPQANDPLTSWAGTGDVAAAGVLLPAGSDVAVARESVSAEVYAAGFTLAAPALSTKTVSVMFLTISASIAVVPSMLASIELIVVSEALVMTVDIIVSDVHRSPIESAAGGISLSIVTTWTSFLSAADADSHTTAIMAATTALPAIVTAGRRRPPVTA